MPFPHVRCGRGDVRSVSFFVARSSLFSDRETKIRFFTLPTEFLTSIFNFRAMGTKKKWRRRRPGHEFTALHDKKYKVNKSTLYLILTIKNFICFGKRNAEHVSTFTFHRRNLLDNLTDLTLELLLRDTK